MENLLDACDRSAEYPRNLEHCNAYSHNLSAYVERLDRQEDKLFNDGSRVAVDFREFEDTGEGFDDTHVHSVEDLKTHYLSTNQSLRRDPRCRFIFLCAPNARERLKITREMCMLLFTYQEVMPAFLDFLLTFGRREHAQELVFSGFRYESRLSSPMRGPSIPLMGRTGCDIRLCYSLRSVEASPGQADWPWSVRQTAVQHSFDAFTGRASWIVVKGNQLMKKRVSSMTDSQRNLPTASFETNAQAFSSTLSTHLIYCDWAGESWRWYLDFLETELQLSTRRTLTVNVDNVRMPGTGRSFNHTAPQATFSSTWTTMVSQNIDPEKAAFASKIPITPPGTPPAHPNDAIISQKPDLRLMPHERTETSAPKDFQFSDLQRVQFLEDKANEVLLVLEVNTNIFAELKSYYQSVLASEDCPADLRIDCRASLEQFVYRLRSIENDMHMQQSRTRSLLRLLGDRKSLLYGILEYRNMEASTQLAAKAQQSAEDMGVLTREMHNIALKTEQETVSMRIITLVTLFFLPGTFISTLMSTDIVQFDGEDKVVSHKALQLFFEISLPLMLVTFGAWYLFYWWLDRKARLNRLHGKIEQIQAYFQFGT